MRLRLLLFALGFGPLLPAQIPAVTDKGDRVLLFADGHWEYVSRDTLDVQSIKTNPVLFSKSAEATFLLKSNRIDVGVWLDPKQWTFEEMDSGASEYELNHKNGSLYALMINENLDLPLNSLANIALENAREAAPDIRLLEKEYRIVNGQQILMMYMVGTIQDIRFAYFGYYYTAKGKATQFLVYSSEDFMNENRSMVEELLNGFVSLNN